MPINVLDNLAQSMQPIVLDEIVVHDSEDNLPPSRQEVMQAHQAPEMVHMRPQHPVDFGTQFSVEVVDPESNLSVGLPDEEDDVPEEADIVIEKDGDPIAAIDFKDYLPGAPNADSDPEIELEVKEEEKEDKDSDDSKDSNQASDSNKKEDKWDWKSKGFGHFTFWVKDRFDSVPKHSGYDLAGLERAHAYLEKLHNEISKAMRADIDGELEAKIIADIHEKIEQGIEKLEDRIEKVKNSKSSKRKKKADESEEGLVKEAQKIFGVQNGVMITVPLFISTLARTLVNGMVSAGRDIEDSYKKLVKKYNLTDREKLELIQLLQDMGLPMIKDRSVLPEDGFVPESTENFDYSANYKA
jgi:hypothetical protein